MKCLLNWGLLLAGGLVGCEQHPRQAAHSAPAAAVVPAATYPAEGAAPELDGWIIRDSLYFGRYLVAHNGEEQAVFYKPHPDSAWLEISRVLYHNNFELDTANVDRAGAPELLLTKSYRHGGSSGSAGISVRYVLRLGRQPDTLFMTLAACEHEYFDRYNEGYYSFDQRQPVTAGYGFVRVGLVRTTCERHRMPTSDCRCYEELLRDAGGARFARPGLYRWQRGQLRWVAAR